MQAICDFVNGHIAFDYQQARSTRTAFEAYGERGWAFAAISRHLAVALCELPQHTARYVNGHLGDIGVPVVDPMDFSAWMEVWLEDRWYTFDPRNNKRRIGRIVVARGRDAADIPLVNPLARTTDGLPGLDLRGRQHHAALRGAACITEPE